MLSHLDGYIEPIVSACVMFPFIAGLFTLPFTIWHYRRFGGIALMRVLIVYSFILYCMCSFLLTVLPLPSIKEVLGRPDQPIGWIPFYDLYVGLRGAGFTLAQPATLVDFSIWKRFLTSRDLFQVIANIVMQIPLGFYLRYYFRRSWKQTLIIGFCVSLFYELTQLTGLYFIYPKPYRYTEVDDLINNTLGAMIGFWITPLIGKLLPPRDEIDKISYDKGHRITVMRRFVAAGIDWLLFVIVWGLVDLLPWHQNFARVFVMTGFFGYILWVLLYFGLMQWLCKGRTLGKMLLKIKVVSDTDRASPPSLKSLVIRYGMIYYLTMPLIMVELMLVGVLSLYGAASMPNDDTLIWLIVICVLMIASTMWVLFSSFKKWGVFPHGRLSHTTIVITAPRKSFSEITASRMDDKDAPAQQM